MINQIVAKKFNIKENFSGLNTAKSAINRNACVRYSFLKENKTEEIWGSPFEIYHIDEELQSKLRDGVMVGEKTRLRYIVTVEVRKAQNTPLQFSLAADNGKWN